MPVTETRTTTSVPTSQKVGIVLIIISAFTFGAAALGILPPIFNHFNKVPKAPIVCETLTTDNMDIFSLRRSASETIRQAQDQTGEALLQNNQILTKSLTHLNARKASFVNTLYVDPKAALELIMPKNKRDNINQKTGNCVEQQRKLSGMLEEIVYYGDDGTEHYQYQLRASEGKSYSLFFTNDKTLAIKHGDEITVNGWVIDSNVLIDNGFIGKETMAEPIKVTQEAISTIVAGGQKFIFFLGHHNDVTQPVFEEPVIDDLVELTDHADAIRAYYDENSFNQTWIEGVDNPANGADAHGWYQLPVAQSCDWNDFILKALTALWNNGVDVAQYDGIATVGTFPSCGWQGVSHLGPSSYNIPGGPTVSIMAHADKLMKKIDDTYFVLDKVIGHEMGHGFGIKHASFLDCVDEPWKETGCTVNEYGDDYNIMANAYTGHYGITQKELMGWLATGNIVDVLEDCTGSSCAYDLEPLEVSGSGFKGLRIQRSVGEDLIISYRQPIGHDADFPYLGSSDGYEGAMIHITGINDSAWSYLLDPTIDLSAVPFPITPNAFYSALKMGDSFTDPLTTTTVTTTAHNPDTINPENSRVTVRVDIGKRDFNPPVITVLDPPYDATVSGTIDLRTTVESPHGIDRVEFACLNCQNPTSLGTLTEPDVSGEYILPIDTTQLPNMQVAIKVTAYDLSGEPFGVSGNVGFIYHRLQINNTDLIAPSITLTEPTDGSSHESPVRFTATASDDIGVWYVTFYKTTSAIPIGQALTSPYETDIELAPGDYTVYAKAFDFVGNETVTPEIDITVTGEADTTPPSVWIQSPLEGSTVGGDYQFRFGANDNVGVTKIELMVDEESVPLATITAPPWRTIVGTHVLADTFHTFTAKAYDAAGNETTSVPVHAGIDNEAPVLTVLEPTGDVIVLKGEPVNVNVDAEDEHLNIVLIFIDGEWVGSFNRLDLPGIYIVDTVTLSVAEHVLRIEARDSAQNVTFLERNINIIRPVVEHEPRFRIEP
ncbi:Ig-like domain-containing protein [Patescibacteria group bacterium]